MNGIVPEGRHKRAFVQLRSFLSEKEFPISFRSFKSVKHVYGRNMGVSMGLALGHLKRVTFTVNRQRKQFLAVKLSQIKNGFCHIRNDNQNYPPKHNSSHLIQSRRSKNIFITVDRQNN